VVYLRTRHKEAVGLDEFLALGLIALAYGAALVSHAYGFLAVFAAGLALQRVKERPEEVAYRPCNPPRWRINKSTKRLPPTRNHASAYMMHAVRGFNEQLERIGELTVVLVVGAMLPFTYIPGEAVWFLLLLFVAVRPVSVWLGLLGARVSRDQHILISWFGIRGIGSIYYLMYAINHGLPRHWQKRSPP